VPHSRRLQMLLLAKVDRLQPVCGTPLCANYIGLEYQLLYGVMCFSLFVNLYSVPPVCPQNQGLTCATCCERGQVVRTPCLCRRYCVASLSVMLPCCQADLTCAPCLADVQL